MDGESPVDLYIEDIPKIENCYLKIMTGKETETEIVKLNQ